MTEKFTDEQLKNIIKLEALWLPTITHEQTQEMAREILELRKEIRFKDALKAIVDLHENKKKERDACLITAYKIAKDALEELNVN